MQEILLDIARISPFLAIVCLFSWRQHKDLRDVEAKRVADLQLILDKFLEQRSADNKATERMARAVERTDQLVHELVLEIREALRELGKDEE